MTRHELRIVTGEERDGADDILRLSQSFDGLELPKGLLVLIGNAPIPGRLGDRGENGTPVTIATRPAWLRGSTIDNANSPNGPIRSPFVAFAPAIHDGGRTGDQRDGIDDDVLRGDSHVA